MQNASYNIHFIYIPYDNPHRCIKLIVSFSAAKLEKVNNFTKKKLKKLTKTSVILLIWGNKLQFFRNELPEI